MLRAFGMHDGKPVEAIRLGEHSGLQVEVLTFGAILRSMSVPVRGTRRELILGLPRLEDYLADQAYVGPVVGRFGNRIADSRFRIDGREHRVTANEGVNHLHGGSLGFGKRRWQIETHAADRAVLRYRSPDGEEGYPGALDVTLSLAVADRALSIRFEATCDAPTPVNLTWHPYFNLAADKRGSATRHRLRIPADHYLPVRAGLIPTGEAAPVAGTPFDFREERPLAPPGLDTHPQLGLAGGYDHCWLLSKDADCACELLSPEGDVRLKMLGSGPGLQFYNGQYLAKDQPTLGSGLILEPQGLPNAPNEPSFPPAILRPGDRYLARIEYQVTA